MDNPPRTYYISTHPAVGRQMDEDNEFDAFLLEAPTTGMRMTTAIPAIELELKQLSVERRIEDPLAGMAEDVAQACAWERISRRANSSAKVLELLLSSETVLTHYDVVDRLNITLMSAVNTLIRLGELGIVVKRGNYYPLVWREKH